jgi:hypothetical protein
MTETTLEDLLRQADALVVQALRETEARCSVLGQYITDCESGGSRTAAWSDAVRELRARHDYRTGLIGRHSLIQQALEYPAGECPPAVSLPAPANRAVRRTQQQVQIRARRRP